MATLKDKRKSKVNANQISVEQECASNTDSFFLSLT